MEFPDREWEKLITQRQGMGVTFVILAAAIQNFSPGYGPLATAVHKSVRGSLMLLTIAGSPISSKPVSANLRVADHPYSSV